MPPAEFTRLIEALCLAPRARADAAARQAFLHWTLRLAPDTDPRKAACTALLRLYPLVTSGPALTLFRAHLRDAAHLRLAPPQRRRRRLH